MLFDIFGEIDFSSAKIKNFYEKILLHFADNNRLWASDVDNVDIVLLEFSFANWTLSYDHSDLWKVV